MKKIFVLLFSLLAVVCCGEKAAVSVTGVSLDKTVLTMDVGGSEKLSATVMPENATDKSVRWSSSDEAVAYVDSRGKVMALKDGTATITVTTTDGGKTATCSVKVSAVVFNVTGVTLNKSSLVLPVGGSETLAATVAPSGATDKSVSWSSSDATVASVDAGGRVTALKVGASTITVTTNDGGKTATCAVTVEIPVEPAEPASAAVKNMGIGLNLNSTFEELEGWPNNVMSEWTGKTSPTRDDPLSYETWCGREVTIPLTMTTMADAGFKTIRIPVTWSLHMDNTLSTIDKVWLDRIEEVVKMALDAGLYCVLNAHHETGSKGWLVADYSRYADLSARFKNIWNQIALRFKDYDYRLLFEGYNEIVDAKGTWYTPSDPSSFSAANKLNQDFVDVVRSTGGRNATRNLLVSTFSAGTREKTLQGFVMPTDKTSGHLIVKVHSYAPSKVCTAQDDHRHYVDSDEPEIEAVFELIQKYVLDKGYPCLIGEYGIFPRTAEKYEIDGRTYSNGEMRGHHAYVYTSKALKRGIVPLYWYNPMDYTYRKWGKWSYPEVKDSLVKAYKNYLEDKK